MKVVKNFDLVIIKKEKEVCKEKCTRVQDQVRSKSDYVLTNKKLLSTATEMIINENKQYDLFDLEKTSRKTFSDPNEILLKLNLITATKKQKKNRIIIKCGCKKYRRKLTKTRTTGLLMKNTIQECYYKWSEKVQNNIW